jgi:hypothetical protein
VVNIRGRSALVEYDLDGMPMRSYVDTLDLQDDKCPVERLADAPYGIRWELDFDGLEPQVEVALKRRGIWTYEDLERQDRAVIRIATNLVGKAIWEAAKRGCE